MAIDWTGILKDTAKAGTIPGLFNMFGGDPTKSANKYLDQIPNAIKPYLDPYFKAGSEQLPGLNDIYGGLTSDPGSVLNKIGTGYQQSPGFKRAMEAALGGSAHAAAAGGMAGSPMHEQQNMELASDLASKDYNNWMAQALGLFGTGLGGRGHMADVGFQAGSSLADQIAQMLAAKSNLAYEGEAAKNKGIGNVIGGITSALPFFM